MAGELDPRTSGHDFREDVPPSFEWWRRWVYEPAQSVMTQHIEAVHKKVDGHGRLLWGVLIVNLTGMLGIVGILLNHPH